MSLPRVPLLADDPEVRSVSVLRDPSVECTCVRYHTPKPIQIHRHHIQPLAWDGPDVPENVMLLCPTTHMNVHELLDEYRRRDGEPPWDYREHFNPFVRDLAEQAWRLRPIEYRL